ncbi:MAG: acyl-CoA thioesterase [Rhizobacter sp.]|nr:acyl-CoA thioesterase [Chlorobiales bacterium]
MQQDLSRAVHALTLRVKYADTDKMQVVYYGRYFEYFEAGRNEMLRASGFEYTRLEALGVQLPVVKAHADYFSPARYDDEIVVESFISELGNVRITIHYDLFEKNSHRKLVSGYTTHAFTTAQGKLMRPPKVFLDAISSAVFVASRDEHK